MSTKRTIAQVREENGKTNTTGEKPKDYWKPNEVAWLTQLLETRGWQSVRKQAQRIQAYLENPPTKIQITKIKFK